MGVVDWRAGLPYSTLERANQVVTCPAARDLKKRQLDDTLEHSLFAAANTR